MLGFCIFKNLMKKLNLIENRFIESYASIVRG